VQHGHLWESRKGGRAPGPRSDWTPTSPQVASYVQA